MYFDEVFSALHAGAAIRRACWSEDQYLILVDGSNFQVSRAPLSKFFEEGTEIEYQPHIVAVYEQDGVACCTDHTLTNIQLFADDWEVVLYPDNEVVE